MPATPRQPRQSKDRTGRPKLDVDLIVAAAIGFVDEGTLDDLTMRRLGGVLGVEAMALYRYVPGRDDLLDLMVASILDEMHDDPDVLDSPHDGWQDYLQRLAHGVRGVALAHPRLFPLVASRPPEAPWLRPPLRSLAWVEAFLSAMIAEGFHEADAVAAYRAFSSFLLGHLLLEVAALGVDLGPDLDAESGGEDLSDFPRIASLRAELSSDHSLAEFEESLENLLERIGSLQSRRRAEDARRG